LTSGTRPVVKINADSLSQHDKKHVVPTPLSGIRVGKSIVAMKKLPCLSVGTKVNSGNKSESKNFLGNLSGNKNYKEKGK
jgi:hypothetical protein